MSTITAPVILNETGQDMVEALGLIKNAILQGATIDAAFDATSENAVQNKVVKAALDLKQDKLTFDTTPTSNSSNPVTSGGIKSALDGKQNTLTFDTTPTSGSGNPITSGGVYSALNGIHPFNYTTDEKVVGTWVTGATMYERTVNCGTLPASGSGQKSTTVSLTYSDIVDINGVVIRHDSTTEREWYPLPYGRDYRLELTVYRVSASSVKIVVDYPAGYGSGCAIYVTLRYVK